jgi:hypothetical protein
VRASARRTAPRAPSSAPRLGGSTPERVASMSSAGPHDPIAATQVVEVCCASHSLKPRTDRPVLFGAGADHGVADSNAYRHKSSVLAPGSPRRAHPARCALDETRPARPARRSGAARRRLPRTAGMAASPASGRGPARPLQLLQSWTRLEAELLMQHGAHAAVGVQRVGLSPSPITS